MHGSTGQDVRGNPVGSHEGDALEAAERALWRMMSFYDTPLADLDAAIATDPHWLLPRVMKAGFLLSLTEPSQVPEARRLLEDAEGLEADAPPRERAHFAATVQVLEGRWHAASDTWDDLLVEHPRDALALQWGQLWDFYRGDAAGLRLRPARSLPEWDESDPLYSFVLGLYAFGLEECNLYPEAEDVGRRALSGEATVPWAVHAVAHVMEMQGRFDEGATWLRQHQPKWSERNGFAGHLWWHLGLFRLEGLDEAGVLRLLDAHLSGDALQITLQRVDAASLLWRLALLDIDVRSRFASLVAAWPMHDDEAGHYAFNDLHVLMALTGAGEMASSDRWLARCAERAMQPEDARRANHAMAREVGLPLMRGLLAFARDEHEVAVQTLYSARRVAQRFGGSHAQRDVIDQTLLAACAGGGLKSMGRALINERRMAKPLTPLTRHWASRLDLPESALA
ncbi:MAG TPA: tetratricopeptide repeat protein [Burkholderiaceae bacterium]|nr:tetratricopeptide repeat protein [Burkholderiaceae bacterium]